MATAERYEFLRVMADYTSTGIWGGAGVPGPGESHRMVEYDDLGLPSELVERFRAWQASYDAREANAEFDDLGRGLALELRSAVGDEIAVYYGTPANAEQITDDTG